MSIYVREDLYRRALGLKNKRSDLAVEFVASSGLCEPLSPVYQLHTIPMEHLRRNEVYARKIAEAYDVPPELLFGIPEELPDGS